MVKRWVVLLYMNDVAMRSGRAVAVTVTVALAAAPLQVTV
jgi:hypothetical protein